LPQAGDHCYVLVRPRLLMMDSAEALQLRYYEATAPQYDEMHVREGDEHFRALAYVTRFIEAFDLRSVVDVGCGTGRAIASLKATHPHLLVRGIDPVQKLLDQAVSAHRVSADHLICARAEQLPFEDATFDAACEFGVLHHLSDPTAAITEMTRVARRALFLSDDNRFGHGPRLSRLAKLLLYECGLWRYVNYIKTRGKGYRFSSGDGVAYSYSIYDSLPLVAKWADRVFVIPLADGAVQGSRYPIIASQHLLLCAFRESDSGV
jgi:ubiquinone/menaquinone biosynthesis C-methylase UbiE